MGSDMKDGRLKAMPTIPIPNGRKQLRTVQADVDQRLFNAAQVEFKKRKLTIKDVMEWGFRAFLANTNPKAAKDLGIGED